MRHIKDVYDNRSGTALSDPDTPVDVDRLCELNVAAQIRNVCHTTIVQDAWRRSQDLTVHGWIYSFKDGLLRDLDLCISDPEQLSGIYRMGGTSGLS